MKRERKEESIAIERELWGQREREGGKGGDR
jgi:hypothetical protein